MDPDEPETQRSTRDSPAQLTRLEDLVERDILPELALERARTLIVSPDRLAAWFDMGLLFMGVGLALAGIVFFFAYNWSELHRFAKLGLLGALLLGGVAVAWTSWSTHPLRAKLGILSSSVLVGVFLAVYGQIYQTGADAWELFAGWAALIMGWTLIARFQALWMLWLIILHVAIGFCWQQFLEPLDVAPEYVSISLVTLDLTLLAGREKLVQLERPDWLRALWGRRALATVTTVLVSWPLILHVAIEADELSSSGLVVFIAYALAIPALMHILWRMSRDAGACVPIGLSFIAVGFAALFRLLADAMEEWSLFPLGIYTIFAFAILVKVLIELDRKEHDTSHQPAIQGGDHE